MPAEDFLDCCANPSTDSVRVLSEGNHDLAAVLRCHDCAAYWYYLYDERVDFNSGDDVQLSWWMRLDDAEATAVLVGDLDPLAITGRDRWLDWDGVLYRVNAAHQGWTPPAAVDGP